MQKFKTAIAQTKGLGSAKQGTNHWVALRISAIMLVPLTFWFTTICIKLFKNNIQNYLNLFNSSFNILCFMLFINFSLYHGLLGMQVIVEDYLHNKLLKRTILLIIYIISLVSCLTVNCTLLTFFVKIFN